jgi:hypothetical protein
MIQRTTHVLYGEKTETGPQWEEFARATQVAILNGMKTLTWNREKSIYNSAGSTL